MLAMGTAILLFGTFPSQPAVAYVAAATSGASSIALRGPLLLWGTQVYAQTPAAGVGLAFVALAIGQGVGSAAVGAVSDFSTAVAFARAAVLATVGGLARTDR